MRLQRQEKCLANCLKIRITYQHTNIVLIEKNNDIIFKTEIENNTTSTSADKDLLTMDGMRETNNEIIKLMVEHH